jgi:ABC-type transporter Mla subunit MlaD
MRSRKGLIAGIVLVVAIVAIVLIASGSSGNNGYVVRGYFDSGGFMVKGEQVRIAGAVVGEVESVDVSMPDEINSFEGGRAHAVPGKAVISMKIEDSGFRDFRRDATCQIRPQSLIGEKYVDCRPTMPRAPGTPLPPPLRVIPKGEPGAGERLLPVENNGTSVDPDLINNIQTLPYAQRFRLILNELGASLAGRGEDIEVAVKRANPDLRDADRVLEILHEQREELAQLASDSDAVLEPLAAERSHVANFISASGFAAQASSERGAELEASLRKFPQFLREFRDTMRNLKGFSDAATPVFEELDRATPALTEATRHLTPFTAASTTAIKSLGNASEEFAPTFASADPVVRKARNLAQTGAGPTTNLAKFLVSTKKTHGWDHLVELIYNGTGAVSEFDEYGHIIRSLVTLTNCLNYEPRPSPGCHAFFEEGAESSSFSVPELQAKIQEMLAEETGGTGAPEEGPTTFLNPATPTEPAPQLGEGESLEAEALGGEAEAGEAEAEAQSTEGAATPARRALLNYLLGP